MIKELEAVLLKTIPNNGKPIVIYSAIWPLVRHFKMPENEIGSNILDIILKNFQSTIFLPTFTNGFVNGICDLDQTPSITGLLSEQFRKMDGVKRTKCPFFSFGVYGKDQKEVVDLIPTEAWGKNSLYEWFYEKDVNIVTIGTHATHCSFTHYAEYLYKDKITYREPKIFKGTLIHESKKIEMEIMHLVRSLNQNAINDFTWLLNSFLEDGMTLNKLSGISFSSMSAKTKINRIRKFLDKDINCLVKK